MIIDPKKPKCTVLQIISRGNYLSFIIRTSITYTKEDPILPTDFGK